jgi:phosphate transport system substrate-binding protein
VFRSAHSPRRLAVAGACATCLVGFVVALTPASPLTGVPASASTTAAAPTATPAIAAAPATELADGQYVLVTLSGFTPGQGLAFRQCTPAPTSIAQCTVADANIVAVADSSGGGTTYVPVFAGNDQLLKSATGPGSIVCDTGHPCVIAGVTTTTDLTNAVFTPIAFGPSPEACPPQAANAVVGGGSSSANRAIYGWESTVCQPPANLSITYVSKDSPDGIVSFLGGSPDFNFAVTGPVSNPPVSGAAPPPAPTFKYAPLTASAVVLAYRMYDRTGAQITDLKLTPDLIAQIFEGAIPNWSVNAAIHTLNPTHVFPSLETTYARAENSAQTFVFTSWLAANAPTTWTAGAEDIFNLPPVGVIGVTGDVGLQVVKLTDTFGNGNIGFMDSSTAAFYGLPTVQITKPDGSSPISATQATVQKAINDATVKPDGTLSVNYTNPDLSAYPMPMPTYMLAPTNSIAPDKGAQLAAFLRYAVQSGQALLSPSSGYVPLPPNLVAESLQVADSIPAQPPPTPTATPRPTARATLPPLIFTPPPSLHATLAPATPAPTGTPCSSSAVSSSSTAASASPSAAAPASPSATAPASPTQCPAAVASVTTPRGSTPHLRPDQRAELALLLREGDSAGARYLLPSIAGLALLGLFTGLGLQYLARRRLPVA